MLRLYGIVIIKGAPPGYEDSSDQLEEILRLVEEKRGTFYTLTHHDFVR